MAETKNEAFHRLAVKRIETVEDAIRVFSNLCGPSYEWGNQEVMAYFERISNAGYTALQRFMETRAWKAQDPDSSADDEPEPAEPDAPAAPPQSVTHDVSPRERQMLRIWAEADNETGALVEMLAMQREVIAALQSQINQLRGG